MNPMGYRHVKELLQKGAEVKVDGNYYGYQHLKECADEAKKYGRKIIVDDKK